MATRKRTVLISKTVVSLLVDSLFSCQVRILDLWSGHVVHEVTADIVCAQACGEF